MLATKAKYKADRERAVIEQEERAQLALLHDLEIEVLTSVIICMR